MFVPKLFSKVDPLKLPLNDYVNIQKHLIILDSPKLKTFYLYDNISVTQILNHPIYVLSNLVANTFYGSIFLLNK